MTIFELLDKYDIKYRKISSDKGRYFFKIANTNVMFWINNGNIFKMKRSWYELLKNDCDKYILFLFDKKEKKYYYLKFLNKNNWFSGSFENCNKSELFLGKEVLNNVKSLGSIINDLKKI